MKVLLTVLFCLSVVLCFAQAEEKERKSLTESAPVAPKASIDQYRIITLDRDTTYVDTSLTIKSEYAFNYLRRDIFGLMPFANEGQPYNTLQFSLREFGRYPGFGRKAKHFNYYRAEDIRYYSVATPLTELYYKTVMEQGHTLDAFLTLNTSERLNFSLAYKGLRSLGKYINQLSSTGNFRFTTSYNTKDRRYFANFHVVAQDILNGENGGITSPEDFEGDNEDFKDRARLEVFFRDAESLLEGKRIFLDHNYRINKSDAANNIYLAHQINYEYKFFEFRQRTLLTTTTDDEGEETEFLRFGDAYATGNLHDRVRYNRLYNKAGAVYENSTLGKFTFFAEDFRYNYFFDKILILSTGTIPGSLSDEIQSIGGQYEYRKNKWRGHFQFSNAVAGAQFSNLEANLDYQINDRNALSFHYSISSKIPDHVFTLNQSSYVAYNWFNDFDNEKINTLGVDATTQWANASLQIKSLDDYLYFSDDGQAPTQLVSPKQYGETIGYLSLKVSREFRFWKLALDNAILYQQTTQDDNILNVPEFTTRNTLYFSDHFFKRALYLQTGITLNYFTEYVGSSRVDLQACKLEYSIVSPK